MRPAAQKRSFSRVGCQRALKPSGDRTTSPPPARAMALPQAFSSGLMKVETPAPPGPMRAADATRAAVDEVIGYWGQKIVLAAQDMGLNTCWCALCSRKKSRAVVAPGKKIRLVIAVGHGKTQGFPRKTKSIGALSSVECAKAPAWFAAAMEAAQLAPTAMNNQNFKITLLSDGKTVRIEAPQSGLNVIDEGIVRRNFEIAANEIGADWRWEREI